MMEWMSGIGVRKLGWTVQLRETDRLIANMPNLYLEAMLLSRSMGHRKEVYLAVGACKRNERNFSLISKLEND